MCCKLVTGIYLPVIIASLGISNDVANGNGCQILGMLMTTTIQVKHRVNDRVEILYHALCQERLSNLVSDLLLCVIKQTKRPCRGDGAFAI